MAIQTCYNVCGLIDMDEQTRPYHEVANLFPLLDGNEYEQLKADIAKNGLLEPIWINGEGAIIDGRNRHRACLDLDIKPKFRQWIGTGSLVSFVVSLNLHRRHLTSSQQSTIAVDALPIYEAEARERQKGGQGGILLPQMFEEANNGEAAELAAKDFGTNKQYVYDAKKIKEDSPDLFEKVKAGELTIPQAKREITKRNKQDPPPLPDDKYRVIYADPPWKYGNSGIIGETDNYGHVGRHYPDMSIAELCDLPIKDLVNKDAVLFLWVTSPLLAECWPVISSWGFTYKTSFVWDKVRHNFGHYNSVRHELLLICTRGSCTPDVNKLFDSVQTIERSDTHSEKPEQFREIIDTLYPHGKRIELFARTDHKGWDIWGNEKLCNKSDKPALRSTAAI